MIGTDFQRSVWKTMDLPVCSTTLKRCGDATRRKISESPTQSLFADYPLMRDHRNLRLRNVDVIEAGAFGVRLLGAVGFDLAPWIEKETGILLEKFGGIDKVIECTVPAKN
jgi:hypothetical protein